MTKFQIASDIHLEFINEDYKFEDILVPIAENLILAGDIGRPDSDVFDRFIGDCCEAFKNVFMISGNHEYYRPFDIKSMENIDSLLKEKSNKYSNFNFLNNDQINIDDNIVLLGTTLWSEINESEKDDIESFIKDYRLIYNGDGENITVNIINGKNRENIKWLNEKITINEEKKVIIITHHLPSHNVMDEKYKDFFMNSAFANNLDSIISDNKNIKCWVFGHSHASHDSNNGNIHMISNPRGYTHSKKIENDNYQKECYIEI
jgi:predicted phosphodiesterase